MNKTRILVIFTFIIFLSIIAIYSFSPQKSTNQDTKFMIIDTYSNYAWGTQFKGTAIYDDGSIYTWNETDNTKLSNYKLGTPEGLKDFIKKEAKQTKGIINEKDLNNLKKYISTLEDNIKISYPGADQGTNTTSVINENNEEIVLKKAGDSVGENETHESQEILKIVEKYIK